MGHVQRDGDKVIIEGVRPVTWKSGEMCEFASCLVSALGSLGEDVSYPYIMGTSGAAFRFTLRPGAWDFGNYAIQNVSPDPFEPVRRAFRAAGYACSIHVPEGDATDEDAARIVGSIDRGVPVLATRVCGPSDCSILTGYDAGGEVLLGWSTYQDIKDDHDIPHDPATGYFRKPGWRGHIPDYTLIGERSGRPPLREVYLDALRWGAGLLRMESMGDRVTGLRGLAAWAAEMRDDASFPAGDEGAMAERYVSTTINITMLRDHCQAEPFLAQVAADAPDLAPEALQAAACYGRVARIRARMDDLIPDDFTERGIRGMYDPAVRRAFADEVLRIRDAEAEAVGCLERLLARCG